MRFEFRRIDRSCVIGCQIEVPLFRYVVFRLKVSHRQLISYCRVEVVEVIAWLSPMSHILAIYDLGAYIGAALLQPIVSDCSEAFGALTAEVSSGEGDVGPSVSGEGDMTELAIFFEGGDGELTHLVDFWTLVFVSFDFLGPVVEVGEVPSGDGVVVENFNSDCVSRITSPRGWFLGAGEEQEGQTEYYGFMWHLGFITDISLTINILIVKM